MSDAPLVLACCRELPGELNFSIHADRADCKSARGRLVPPQRRPCAFGIIVKCAVKESDKAVTAFLDATDFLFDLSFGVSPIVAAPRLRVHRLNREQNGAERHRRHQ